MRSPKRIKESRSSSNPNSFKNSPSPEASVDDWSTILDCLKENASLPKKRASEYKGNDELLGKLDRLVSNYGMPAEAIEEYVKWLLSEKIEVKVVRQIVLLLIPRYLIPENIIFRILGGLSIKNSQCAQHILLRWVAALLQLGHFFDSTTKLQRAYTILFHYLIYDRLRPHVAHILYLITRPHHVQPYRIRTLMSLQARFPGDISLAGLMAFYKQVCPGRVVLGRGLLRPARVFSLINSPWQSLVSRLWMSWNSKARELDVTRRLGLKLGPSEKGFGLRRRKELDLSLPLGITATPKQGQTPLYLLPTWEELLDSIDALALPDCSAAYLEDRHLQLYVMCNNMEDNTEGWLTHALRDATLWTDQNSRNNRAISRLLRNLVSCTRRTGRLPLSMKTFFRSYLITWDGISHQSALFELLTYYPLTPFQELYTDVLSPLLRFAPIGSSPQFSSRILGVFVCILRRWMSAAPSLELHIEPFVSHVNRFTIVSLQMFSDHPLLLNQALNWLELLAEISLDPGVPLVTFSFAELVKRIFFTVLGGMTTSRLCGILEQFRSSFVRLAQDASGHSRDFSVQKALFFEVALDIVGFMCNSIGFGPHKRKSDLRIPFGFPSNFESAVFKLIEQQGFATTERVFSLTITPCFSLFAHSFISQRYKPQESPQFFALLTPGYFDNIPGENNHEIDFSDFRIQFLDHLQELGFEGVQNFLKPFVTQLPERNR